MVGRFTHPPAQKPDPSGSQKRNIKVNPGGVGGCTHPFGSQTFGEILKWIFYKKGEFLMIWKYGWNHHPAENGPTVLPGNFLVSNSA